MVSYLLAEFLPSDNEIEKLKVTNKWMIAYIYVPLFLYGIIAIILFKVVKYEPIKFSLDKGNTKEAKLAVMQMYKYA